MGNASQRTAWKQFQSVWKAQYIFQQFYLVLFVSVLSGHKTDRLAFGAFPILSDTSSYKDCEFSPTTHAWLRRLKFIYRKICIKRNHIILFHFIITQIHFFFENYKFGPIKWSYVTTFPLLWKRRKSWEKVVKPESYYSYNPSVAPVHIAGDIFLSSVWHLHHTFKDNPWKQNCLSELKIRRMAD